MLDPLIPGLTGSQLDRVDHLREDPDAIIGLRESGDARLLLLDGLDPILTEDETLTWGPLDAAPDDVDFALLGLLDGAPRFIALTPHAAGARSPALMQALTTMPGSEAGTYAAARSLIDWHSRHRFCSQCGTPTTVIRAGWSRQCTNCGMHHFPRTDPVVIMLAEREGRVVLGRQPRFPAGRYSALAGFIEVGESIEEAVAREIKEEAGVVTSNVRYVASQPWPFPSSLMIACIAQAESDTIRIDEKELEDARWFDRDQVAAALANAPEASFGVPPPYAIAHTLLQHWVRGL